MEFVIKKKKREKNKYGEKLPGIYISVRVCVTVYIYNYIWWYVYVSISRASTCATPCARREHLTPSFFFFFLLSLFSFFFFPFTCLSRCLREKGYYLQVLLRRLRSCPRVKSHESHRLKRERKATRSVSFVAARSWLARFSNRPLVTRVVVSLADEGRAKTRACRPSFVHVAPFEEQRCLAHYSWWGTCEVNRRRVCFAIY